MNEKKWLRSIVLLAAFMVIVPAANANTVFYTDGFESYDLGYDPDPPALSIADSGNWTFSHGYDTAGVVDTKAYSGGTQSYSIGSTAYSSASMETVDKVPVDATDVVFNAKIYLGDSGDNFVFRPTAIDSDRKIIGRIQFRCSGTNTVELAYYSNGGYVTGSSYTNMLGKWLDITLTFDSSNETYDYSIVDTTDSTVLDSLTGIAYGLSGSDVDAAYFSSGRYGSGYANQRNQYVDDVVISGVPEPATLLLLAGGSLGVLLRRKRG